jgi:hypothetical protein
MDSEELPKKLPKKPKSQDKDYSEALAPLLAAVAGDEAELVDLQPLLLPTGEADPGYLVYEGSRTAPPCEDSLWMVKRTPVRASSVQLAKLIQASRQAVKDNWRTIMPLPVTTNVRILEPEFGGVQPADGKEPSASHGPQLPSGPNARTDRERSALFASKKARQVAEQLGKDVASLDGRAQRAAMARRNALSPTTQAPIDMGFGRLSAKDALVVAESIQALGPKLGGDIHQKVQELHNQIENAAHDSARRVADGFTGEVKGWYNYYAASTTTPPPPPPPPLPPLPKKKGFPVAKSHWGIPTEPPDPTTTTTTTTTTGISTTGAPAAGGTTLATTTAGLTVAPAFTAAPVAVAWTAAPTAATAAPTTTAFPYHLYTTASTTTPFPYHLYTTTAATTTYATTTTPFPYHLYTTTTPFPYHLYTTTAATTTFSPYTTTTFGLGLYTTAATTTYPLFTTTGGTTTYNPFATTGTTTVGFGAYSYTTANPFYTTTPNPFLMR